MWRSSYFSLPSERLGTLPSSREIDRSWGPPWSRAARSARPVPARVGSAPRFGPRPETTYNHDAAARSTLQRRGKVEVVTPRSTEVDLLPPWIEGWLAEKDRAGCSSETVRRYRWAVLRTDRALREAGRSSDPALWTPRDARWLRQQFHDEVHQLTVTANLARFCRNPVFRSVGLPRRGPPKRVRWLTEEQTEAILTATRRDRHLRLVVLLGLGQGLRRGDWVRLRMSDIDLDGRRMQIRMGHRPPIRHEWVPMHPALPDAFRDYLWLRRRKVRRFLRVRPGVQVPDEVFLHLQGGSLTAYRPHGADKWVLILQRRMADQGVDVRLSTDMLRRRGAVILEQSLQRTDEEVPDEVREPVRRFLRVQTDQAVRAFVRAVPNRSGDLRGRSNPLPRSPRTRSNPDS